MTELREIPEAVWVMGRRDWTETTDHLVSAEEGPEYAKREDDELFCRRYVRAETLEELAEWAGAKYKAAAEALPALAQRMGVSDDTIQEARTERDVWLTVATKLNEMAGR